MNSIRPFFTLFLAALSLLMVASCQKKKGCLDPKANNYDPEAEKEDGSCEYGENTESPPSSYDFDDADLKPGRVRIELLDRLQKEVAKGEMGASIALQDLYDPYRNNGVAGNGVIDLESTLNNSDSVRFQNILQDIASRSGNSSSIVAGRFVSSDSIAYTPLVKRGLMGRSFFRYATRKLLENLDAASNVDPEISLSERERIYDEAFSLFGVPKDLTRSKPFGTSPNYGEGVWFWGSSLKRTDSASGSLPSLFADFVEARWAITEKKEDRRRKTVRKVEKGWERLAGAVMIRHIKKLIRAIDENKLGNRIHHWSIVHATLLGLNANDDGTISSKEHQKLRDKLGQTPNETDIASLNDIMASLQSIYGFSNKTLQAL